jgi:serine phosphatase RsbU (regulator of sigma subunit)/Tfp pilus assembly protein PilF
LEKIRIVRELYKPAMNCLLVIILLLNTVIAAGQANQQVDSLITLMNKTENDTTKVKICMDIGTSFEYTAPDSAVYFYDLALSYAVRANSFKFRSVCYMYLGSLYSRQGIYDKALENYMSALRLREEMKDEDGIARCFDEIGIVYFFQGAYDKSVMVFMKALKIRENRGDKRGIAKSYNNIGNVNYSMMDYDKALEYYTKSLTIILELGDKNGISACYNNIGLVYLDHANTLTDIKNAKEKYLKAIDYFNKSLQFDIELEDKKGMSACYSNIGIAYFKLGFYDKSISYNLKALKIDEELGDIEGASLIYGNLADFHIKLKDFNAAVDYAEKSLAIGKEIGALPIQQSAYEKLAYAYEGLANYKKAYECFRGFKLVTDSIFNLESNKQVKQLEAHYQSEKKQLEIDNLTKDRELKDKELSLNKKDLQKQRITIYSFILGLLMVGVFSILLYRQYRSKKAANILLAKQNVEIQTMNKEISFQRDELKLFNAELQQKNEEIMAQRDEIESHLDRIQKQKTLIEQKNNSITASISYAQRIQRSVLPDEKHLRALFPESFVLFKPKDIVSGDFYWIGEKAEKIFIAAVDCTGHGVPGAFMSLLGYVFLNQALYDSPAGNPAELLNFLNNIIYTTLRRSEADSSIKDGMDLSVCAIHKDTMRMEYAGVHNASYLLRKKEIIELKHDNFQIGEPFSEKFSSFTNRSIELEKDDLVYLFTDGYLDQFGGQGFSLPDEKPV